MQSRDMLKKIKLKHKLMKECGAFVEDLSDYTEPANYVKIKNFTRFSKKTFMKDYKRAMKDIDDAFNTGNGVSRGKPLEKSGAEAPEDKTNSRKDSKPIKCD